MNFYLFIVLGFFLAVDISSARGIRLEKAQFHLDDDFTEVSKVQGLGGSPDEPIVSLKMEKVKSNGGNEQGVNMEATHQTVDQENIGSDKRRKFLNGRNYQPSNLTVEYTPSKDNETWNVEKRKKNMDSEAESESLSCQVTTEELVTTAQATVTRALKGLCNSNDMEERFDDLENSLARQLHTIRNMIVNLEKRIEEQGDIIVYGQKQLSAAISRTCSVNGGLGNGGNGGGQVNPDLHNKNHKTSHDFSKSTPGLNDDVSDEEVSGPRDAEILKFNSSIHVETGLNGVPKKVFTYYWKIKDMLYKLSGWNPRKSIRSQSFYIFPSGYRMYLRVFPRQNEDNFIVRVGLTKGEFDDSLKWPFPLKNKIHILDQTKEGRLFEDIASRVWDPNSLCSDFNWQKPIKGDNHECVEVGFPHDVLRQREYIRKDTLVIRFTVYLES